MIVRAQVGKIEGNLGSAMAMYKEGFVLVNLPMAKSQAVEHLVRLVERGQLEAAAIAAFDAGRMPLGALEDAFGVDIVRKGLVTSSEDVRKAGAPGTVAAFADALSELVAALRRSAAGARDARGVEIRKSEADQAAKDILKAAADLDEYARRMARGEADDDA